MKESKIFGVILKRLRKEHGMSQEEVGGAIEEQLDQAAISRIETGTQVDIGITDLVNLLAVFGISLALYVQMRDVELKNLEIELC